MEKDIRISMEKSLESLRNRFKNIRAGRANVDMLSNITVEYYGSATPINQVATLSVTDAKTIVIDPWDKSILGDIEKTIRKSNLNINPINDGNVIRLILPDLTEERRKEYLKVAKKELEEGKISIRNIRKNFLSKYKELEDKGDISENELKSFEKKLQALTDEYIKKMDDLYDKKEKDILQI